MNLNNRVHLIGKVCNMPVLKNAKNNDLLMRFSLKTVDRYKIKDKFIDDFQYHQIVAWNDLAEKMSAVIMTGSEIVVEGRLTHRKYDDSEGNSKFISEIVALSILVKNPPLMEIPKFNKSA